MAVTTHTLTGNVVDLTGVDRADLGKVVARLYTNLPAGQKAILDLAGKKLRLGSRTLTLDQAGKWSAAGLVSSDSADVLPEGVQYRVEIEFPDETAPRGRGLWDSGWFELNGTGTSDIVQRVEVDLLPPSYRTQAVEQLQTMLAAGEVTLEGIVAQAVAAAEAAGESAEGAAAAGAAAGAAAAEHVALAPVDEQMATVARDRESEFASELSASIAGKVDEAKYQGFLLAAFLGNGGNQQTLNLFKSDDGKAWEPAGNNPVYAPTDGTVVRDPSIVHFNGAFYVAHTRTDYNGDSFDVITSRDLVEWRKVATVSTAGAGTTHSWAPEFVIDGNDVWIVVSVDNTAMYRVKATSRDLTTWSAPQKVVLGPTEPFSAIDGSFMKIDGAWHCFFRDKTAEQVTTLQHAVGGPNFTDPFTIVTTGNWAGWGTGVEAPNLVRLPDGRFRLYYDPYAANTGMRYSDSADLVTWSASAPLTVTPALTGGVLRHGTVWPITNPAAASVAAQVYAGRNTGRFQGIAVAMQTAIASTTWVDLLGTNNDLLIRAKVDDLLEVFVAGRWGSEATFGSIDVHTVDHSDLSTSIRSLASGVAPVADGGSLPGLTGEPGVTTHAAGGTVYRVKASDISATGKVRLRLKGRSGGPAKNWGVGYATNNPRTYFRAINHGPAQT